jgi:hypothetical protein
MQTLQATSFPLVVTQWIIIGILFLACFSTRLNFEWGFKFTQWTGNLPSVATPVAEASPSIVYL